MKLIDLHNKVQILIYALKALDNLGADNACSQGQRNFSYQVLVSMLVITVTIYFLFY